MKFDEVVIFGGCGFIGSHLTRLLLDSGCYSKVVLADIVEPDLERFGYFLTDFIENGKVIHVSCDVRDSSSFNNLPDSGVHLIVNLAAIHREPGHESSEYFETNILGAENVCAWAENVECNKIIFTSSIAPYGPCEDMKTETSIPCPETAYGSSKLVAEKIHQAWQREDANHRRLVVVRPGVVFGPGEGGNVTRLVRAVLGRYFFFMGNRETIKAGVYVKELCHSLLWALEQVDGLGSNGRILYNASMNPAPSVEGYVAAICKVARVKRLCPNIPYGVLYTVAWMLEVVARPLGISHPFSPVRIRKLVRSNNIQAELLSKQGYKYHFSLESALLDWKGDKANDWK